MASAAFSFLALSNAGSWCWGGGGSGAQSVHLSVQSVQSVSQSVRLEKGAKGGGGWSLDMGGSRGWGWGSVLGGTGQAGRAVLGSGSVHSGLGPGSGTVTGVCKCAHVRVTCWRVHGATTTYTLACMQTCVGMSECRSALLHAEMACGESCVCKRVHRNECRLGGSQ